MPQLLICMCCILNHFPNAYKAHICKGKYYRSIYRSNLIKGKNHSSVKIVGARKRWPTPNRNHSVFRSRSNNACSLYRIHSDTIFLSGLLMPRCRARKQLSVPSPFALQVPNRNDSFRFSPKFCYISVF